MQAPEYHTEAARLVYFEALRHQALDKISPGCYHDQVYTALSFAAAAVEKELTDNADRR